MIGAVPIDPAGHTSGVTLGGAIFPGTATLTALWLDSSGTLQKTSFHDVGT